jgi:hypothetical protein
MTCVTPSRATSSERGSIQCVPHGSSGIPDRASPSTSTRTSSTGRGGSKMSGTDRRRLWRDPDLTKSDQNAQSRGLDRSGPPGNSRKRLVQAILGNGACRARTGDPQLAKLRELRNGEERPTTGSTATRITTGIKPNRPGWALGCDSSAIRPKWRENGVPLLASSPWPRTRSPRPGSFKRINGR